MAMSCVQTRITETDGQTEQCTLRPGSRYAAQQAQNAGCVMPVASLKAESSKCVHMRIQLPRMTCKLPLTNKQQTAL